MIDALRKIDNGEVSTTVFSAGIWHAENMDSAPRASATAGDADLLHMQIGIAIGYGYVVGAARQEDRTVRYEQLTLTGKGREFLATMESSPSVTEKARPRIARKAAAAAIAGLLIVVSLALVLSRRFIAE